MKNSVLLALFDWALKLGFLDLGVGCDRVWVELDPSNPRHFEFVPAGAHTTVNHWMVQPHVARARLVALG